MNVQIAAAGEWLVGWLRSNGTAPDEIGESTNFVESGIIDSFGTIQLVAAAEEHFGIRFDEDDFAAPEFVVVGGFARITAARITGR